MIKFLTTMLLGSVTRSGRTSRNSVCGKEGGKETQNGPALEKKNTEKARRLNVIEPLPSETKLEPAREVQEGLV